MGNEQFNYPLLLSVIIHSSWIYSLFHQRNLLANEGLIGVGIKKTFLGIKKTSRHEETLRQEERKEGRKEGGNERRKEGRREGGKEGRKEGRREGRREGGKEGRKEGGKEVVKEEGKEGGNQGGEEGEEGGKDPSLFEGKEMDQRNRNRLNFDRTMRWGEDGSWMLKLFSLGCVVWSRAVHPNIL